MTEEITEEAGNLHEGEESLGAGAVEIGDLDTKPLPQLDVTKFVGKKVVIEKVVCYKGDWGFYLKAETVPVVVLDNGTEIRARKNYGLFTDEDGKPFIGEGSKLHLELQKYKLTKWQQLKGLTVMLQTIFSKKDRRDYLTW